MEKGTKRLLLWEGAFSCILVVILSEAVPAVNRPVPAGLEGDLGNCTASGAGGDMEFTPGTGTLAETASVSLLAGGSAIRATAGFVGEPFLRKKLLFGNSKDKFAPTVPTGQSLVYKHKKTSSCYFAQNGVGWLLFSPKPWC
jgi:hypothetical protein